MDYQHERYQAYVISCTQHGVRPNLLHRLVQPSTAQLGASMKYLVLTETGTELGQFSNQKDLTAFWNSEVGLNLTIVQSFGRKGYKMTFIVREIK